jgi:quinol monooxygenase YgiN
LFAAIAQLDLLPSPKTQDALRSMLELTRSFPGNVRVDVLADPEDPARWLLYELWEDRASQQAYVAHRRAHAAADPLAGLRGEKPTTMTFYEVRN